MAEAKEMLPVHWRVLLVGVGEELQFVQKEAVGLMGSARTKGGRGGGRGGGGVGRRSHRSSGRRGPSRRWTGTERKRSEFSPDSHIPHMIRGSER